MYAHSSVALKVEMKAVEERFGLHRSGRSVGRQERSFKMPKVLMTIWQTMLALV